MVNIGAEQRFRRVQQAVERAHDYADKRDYRKAASALEQASGMIPKSKKDPFYQAYTSLRSEIGVVASQVAEGLGAQYTKSYQQASEELRKLKTLPSIKAEDAKEAKKKIRYVENHVAQYTGGPAMPKEITRPMKANAKTIAKLKTELEDLAVKNGVRLDWSKD
ncbi:MAG: hypothetical protein HY515_02405 [Candidatus Aenigmarchaeota archaeon]|nr:hypothetical protein [Candidatus Aenigmarchaeota archaeon]